MPDVGAERVGVLAAGRRAQDPRARVREDHPALRLGGLEDLRGREREQRVRGRLDAVGPEPRLLERLACELRLRLARVLLRRAVEAMAS